MQDNDAPARIIPFIRRRTAARLWQLSLSVSIPGQQVVNCRKNLTGNDLVTMYLPKLGAQCKFYNERMFGFSLVSSGSLTRFIGIDNFLLFYSDGSGPVPGTPQGIYLMMFGG